MNPNKFVLLLFFATSLFNACDDSKDGIIYPPNNESKVTITQGAWGNVWFLEGNFMPGSPSGKITPVIRDIYIYEATTDSMTEPPNTSSFRTKINSQLISIIRSDKNGFFQVYLPPGKYSFFVKEDTLFYANLWDIEGYIQSAIVIENKVTERQIDIDYKAYY
ncbi:MAG: hypothetical protein WAU11_14695 [Ignavibacteriaceae bacterium]